jgi:putative phosphoserine phosphatase / 1-acylglycerol-3-phosphate O-acyltransferase
MPRAAAFFDLDRTLLAGASGPIFSAALREAGLLPARSIPGEGLVYKVFNAVGETLPGMALARQAATVASGWSADAVVAAATEAAKVLTGSLQPWARQLMDEHRAAGRPVVLATTTPFDMVKPFADELGLDDVVATRYGRNDDGTYDGSISGNFVWSRGKLAAVRLWADEHGVDLRESWAYSDSIYDAPLLQAVGNPAAVNPDPRLHVLATVRRWPVLHLDVPPGVPKVVGVEPWQALRPLLRPEAFPFARFRIEGAEHVPERGPGIVVANHRSYADVLAVALTVARSGRPLRFLGKKEVFDAPVVGALARAMGGIRVERGSGATEPLDAAARALEAGELVALMPQGTIPRGPAFFDPELKGRPGAARLAARTGAPVIPLGLWGTERVWPRNARIPRLVTINPPQVTTRVGPPVAGLTGDLTADTARIMEAISALLPPEAHLRREPTAAELAATYPAGHRESADT